MPRRDPCFVSEERLVSSNRQRVRRKDKERTEGNVWSGRGRRKERTAESSLDRERERKKKKKQSCLEVGR